MELVVFEWVSFCCLWMDGRLIGRGGERNGEERRPGGIGSKRGGERGTERKDEADIQAGRQTRGEREIIREDEAD